MEYQRFGVIQIGPVERFLILYISREGGHRLSDELNESDLRNQLHKLGLTVAEINLRIERARQNPM